jgi:protein SCO1
MKNILVGQSLRAKRSNLDVLLILRDCFVAVLLAMTAVSPLHAEIDKSPVLSQIGFDQKLGAQVPLDLVFTNEQGQPVKLASYFHGQPVVLNLVYYRCPMLCGEVLNGILRAIRTLKFNVGQEYSILTISFDPREKPALAAKKGEHFRMQYGRPIPEGGWPFLTGDEASIRKLAETVGFRYVYDKSIDQYAHAAGLVILTPDGKASHYMYGVEYSPRDMKFALIEASKNVIGSPVDQLLLYCYHYDPTSGRYGLAIMRFLRISAVLMILGVAAFITIMIRREKNAA